MKDENSFFAYQIETKELLITFCNIVSVAALNPKFIVKDQDSLMTHLYINRRFKLEWFRFVLREMRHIFPEWKHILNDLSFLERYSEEAIFLSFISSISLSLEAKKIRDLLINKMINENVKLINNSKTKKQFDYEVVCKTGEKIQIEITKIGPGVIEWYTSNKNNIDENSQFSIKTTNNPILNIKNVVDQITNKNKHYTAEKWASELLRQIHKKYLKYSHFSNEKNIKVLLFELDSILTGQFPNFEAIHEIEKIINKYYKNFPKNPFERFIFISSKIEAINSVFKDKRKINYLVNRYPNIII